MFLEYTEDEQAIYDAFAAFFEKECPPEVVRSSEPLGFSQPLWEQLCETGAVGMAMPVAWGGGGASLTELGIVVSLVGAHLAPVPLIEHAVASRLIAELRQIQTGQTSGYTSSQEAFYTPAPIQSNFSQPTLALLESLIDGSKIATLALRPAKPEVPDNPAPDNPAAKADASKTRADSSTSASPAIAKLLPSGAVAEVFLTLSESGNSVDQLIATTSSPSFASLPNTANLPIANRAIFSAGGATGGTDRASDEAFGAMGKLEMSAADNSQPGKSYVLASGEHVLSCYAKALSEWKALTAIALCGLGRRALEIGVDYALERKQFDRPIGSFQAVQHGLADAAVELEAAWYLCQRALWMLDTAQPQAAVHASMSFLFASEAAQKATAAVLHYHGGYGYATEYDIGLYYRRAKGWSLIYDDPANEYQRLANTLP